MWWFPDVPAAAQSEPSTLLELAEGDQLDLSLPRLPSAVAIEDPSVASVIGPGLGGPTRIVAEGPGTTNLLVQFGPRVPVLVISLEVGRDPSATQRPISPGDPAQWPHLVVELGTTVVQQGAIVILDRLSWSGGSPVAAFTEDPAIASVVGGAEVVLAARRPGDTLLALEQRTAPHQLRAGVGSILVTPPEPPPPPR